MRPFVVVLAVALGCRREATPPPTPTPTPTPSPTIAEDARPLLDAWATALGGRDRLGPLPYHHRSETHELWISTSGQVREVSTADGLREVRVFDGTRGWLIDHDGETRELAPRELELVRLSGYLYGGAALFPERGTGTITRAGDDAIEVSLGTRQIQIWFDPNTHLPVGYAERGIARHVAPGFGDWREIDGVKVAHALQTQDGSRVAPFELVDHAPAPSGAFDVPTEHPRDIRLVHPLPIRIPLLVGIDGLAYARVDLGGSSQLLLVDSGAGDVTVDRAVVERLGLQPFGKTTRDGSEGKLSGGWVRGLTFTLGDVVFTPAVAESTSLGELARSFPNGLDGMLGYAFLSRLVVELDYRGRTMTLHDPDTYRHSGAGAAVPITLELGVPHIEATLAVDGELVTGSFILDTGCACMVSANTPFSAAHPALVGASELRIGSSVVKRPRISTAGSVAGPGGPAHARRDFDGLIGAELGNTFRIVLDYRHQRLWLDPL